MSYSYQKNRQIVFELKEYLLSTGLFQDLTSQFEHGCFVFKTDRRINVHICLGRSAYLRWSYTDRIGRRKDLSLSEIIQVTNKETVRSIMFDFDFYAKHSKKI